MEQQQTVPATQGTAGTQGRTQALLLLVEGIHRCSSGKRSLKYLFSISVGVVFS